MNKLTKTECVYLTLATVIAVVSAVVVFGINLL